MAGIYIHIPFCKSRCIYCGFYSTTSLDLRQRYVDAVCKEIIIRNEELKNRQYDYTIETIYLGGGTPSQLRMAQLRQILDTLFIYNKVAKDAEISMEVNPDDVTEEFAEDLKSLPVNRVSMGAQTFTDELLKFLHRRHNSSQVSEAVRHLRRAGIRNISIDLMYGFPKETLSDWEHDINCALSLDIEHLSAYCLSIEEGTPLHKMFTVDNLQLKDDYLCEELERQMYELLIDRLDAVGYEHYEISNFAKKGFRSRHNSGYWNGTPYIGLGAAAHSYDGQTRSWNISDIHQYIEGMERGERNFESETIEGDTRYNDMVTVALRTREGLRLAQLSDAHKDYCMKNARRLIDDGLLQYTSGLLSITRKGLFVSDMIISNLMKV